MLKQVSEGTQVTLANGLSATVTRIQKATWGSATYFIKANNGKFAERKYTENGKAISGESKFAITKVTSGFNAEKAKDVMSYTAEELRELANQLEAGATAQADGSEPKAIDFGDGKGAVMAARHLNSDGCYGGYVAETAFVDESIRVARGSQVFGNAVIEGTGRIINNAKVGISMYLEGETIDGTTLSYTKLAKVA